MANSDSFFNEIYGTYFNVVSSILRQAQEKQLTKDSLELLVREQAFADSCLTIPKALQDGSWPLLQKNMTTPLRHAPAMPLTTLQRRWLKSLLTDKRIQLFDVDCSGLEDVEPLFCEGSLCISTVTATVIIMMLRSTNSIFACCCRR